MPRSGPGPRGGSPATTTVGTVGAAGDPPAGVPLDTDPVADLRRYLRRLHRQAGEPSTRTIARQIGTISHTTVHSVLRCEKAPSWAHLELIVEALAASAPETASTRETATARKTAGATETATARKAAGATEPATARETAEATAVARARELWLATRPVAEDDADDLMDATMSRTTKALSAFLAIVELLQSLVGKRQPAPLLFLVTAGRRRAVLPLLAGALDTGPRPVPHARLSADGVGLPVFLAQVAHQLAPLPFRRLYLVTHLMAIDPPATSTRELGARLATARGAGILPRLLAVLLDPVRWFSGWLLPVGGAIRDLRWLQRQPYLAPRQSRRILDFAERLAAGPREHEDREQLDKLLVHAFLQDLSEGYRRRPWRLAPWRRTARPVLLLDDCAPGNLGYRLLRLVNDVRNETGPDDPLLIVAAGRAVPPDGLPLTDCSQGWVAPWERIRSVHQAWLELLPEARRRRERTAWYLPVGMPPVADDSALRSRTPRIPAPAVPLLARRGVLAALTALLLIVAAVPGYSRVAYAVRARAAGCYPLTSPDEADVVWTPDGQCVGYSADERQLFGADPALVQLERKIFLRNRVADPRRRPLTVVYLTQLSPRAGELSVGQRAELAGLAAAQSRVNSADTGPYLRVVVANAGLSAGHGTEVAAMLAALARRDGTVAAVVSALPSTVGGRDMLRALDAAGLMTVAPNMSADGVGDGLGRFLQLAAPNRDQAQLVHRYVTQVLRRPDVLAYYPARSAWNGDLYVDTLRADLRHAFGGYYQESSWTPGLPMTDICRDRFGGVVVYAGRYADFPAFVAQIYRDCAVRLPFLVASGDVGDFVAEQGASSVLPAGFPAAIVSAGGATPCDRLAASTNPQDRMLLVDLRVTGTGCVGPGSVDRLTSTYYDAALLVATAAGHAIQAALPAGLTPATLYSQILYDTDTRPYQGVSGPIQFDRTGAPAERPLTLRCVADLRHPEQTPAQGPAVPDRPCPS